MLELHCHTRCSDGSLSPAELLAQASRLGVTVLAVTDHDTMAAYDELWDIAKFFRIQLIPGNFCPTQPFRDESAYFRLLPGLESSAAAAGLPGDDRKAGGCHQGDAVQGG